MSEKTISHCQGKGSLTHNNRRFLAANIDRSRVCDNITFVCKSIDEAYHELFDAAVEEYNSRQKRKDRCITTSYYEYQFGCEPRQCVVTSPDKRKSFYEDVVQIGCKDDTGVGSYDGETAKQCLIEYMNGFQSRNPNFIVFNSVLHMDEATPHLHIDYIPIGHYKRGVPVQNGITQALKEMGYGGGEYAIARWRQAECDVLKEIAERHGFTIKAPEKSRGTMSVGEYKEFVQLEERMESLQKMEIAADDTILPGRRGVLGNYVLSDKDYKKFVEEKQALSVQQELAEQKISEYQQKCTKLNEERDILNERERRLKESEDRADSLMKQAQEKYDSQLHLNETLDAVMTQRDNYRRDNILYRQENCELESKVSEKEQELSAVKKKLSDEKQPLEKRISELERSVRDKNNEISSLNEEISAKDNELSQSKEKYDTLCGLYDNAYELSDYFFERAGFDYSKCLSMKIEGYSFGRIFSDGKTR